MNPKRVRVLLQRSWLLPLTVTALIAAAVAWRLSAAPTLMAQGRVVCDSDDDGLVNGQESILGTSSFRADTDADGYSDLEELARRTSPTNASSLPDLERLQVGMTCRGQDGQLHALVAIYLPDGNLRTRIVEAGVVVRNRIVKLSDSFMLTHARVSVHDASLAAAKIAVFDIPFSPRFVRLLQHMTLFVTVGTARAGVVAAADKIELFDFAGTIVLKVASPVPIVPLPSLQAGGHSQPPMGASGLGSIYIPLPLTGTEDAATWTAGQICVQNTQIVGVSGPMVIQEIVSAECQEGWEGYCPPNCSSSVGSTSTTVDPAALIGG